MPIHDPVSWQSDLIPHIKPFSDTYASSLYHALASDSEIQSFLAAEPLWDNTHQEWITVAGEETLEGLRANVRDIVEAIISKLGKKSSDDQITREARLTIDNPLPHRERYEGEGGTSPTIVVKATGPSFEHPLQKVGEDVPVLGFSNAATYIDVGHEFEMSTDDVRSVQSSSVSARQILIQQPNRRFVRSLLMTEELCQMFHFDHSGAQYTPTFNIHDDVNTFIRIILGLSSFDEDLLGLDTAVQWNIEDDRKVSGTFTLYDAAGAKTIYPLHDVEPSVRRWGLHGRGTTGWRVNGPDGDELFIKDSWRAEDAVPEQVILKQLAGRAGVARMVSFEARHVTTAQLRACGASTWSMENFSDRVFTRIVMEDCGKPLQFFESQTQLLGAMRDAIAAHQVLVNDHDILHRDISANNVLIAPQGAQVGQRGKLIDFDMAFQGPRPLAQTRNDIKVGTVYYMAASMLRAQQGIFPLCPFHDQLDDLESFYYILYDFMFSHTDVGTPVEGEPFHQKRWGAETFTERAVYKRGHFNMRPQVSRLSPFWRPATIALLDAFFDLTFDLVTDKEFAFDFAHEFFVDRYKAILARADEYYEKVLAMFDKAIDALEKDDADHQLRSSDCTASTPKPSPDPSDPHSDETDENSNTPNQVGFPSNSKPSDLDDTPTDPSEEGPIQPRSRSVLAIGTEQDGKTTAQLPEPSMDVAISVSSHLPLPTTLKRRSEFDDEPFPPKKRGRTAKLDPAKVSRKAGWVRTSPHRTRAWVKAHAHLNLDH